MYFQNSVINLSYNGINSAYKKKGPKLISGPSTILTKNSNTNYFFLFFFFLAVVAFSITSYVSTAL